MEFVVESKNLNLLKIFIHIGQVDVNESVDMYGTKLLHLAAAATEDCADLISYILPLVQEKNPYDSKGNSPLQFALRNGQVGLSRLFLPYVKEDFWTNSHNFQGTNSLLDL